MSSMQGGVAGGGSATWSDRFEQGLHPVIERFNASIGFDIALLQEDLDGSIAHAHMLAEWQELIQIQVRGFPEPLTIHPL